MTARSTKASSFVVCVRNDGFAASLETRKIYEMLPDSQATASGMIRVIDESGEDYLYPAEWFIPIHLNIELRSALGGFVITIRLNCSLLHPEGQQRVAGIAADDAIAGADVQHAPNDGGAGRPHAAAVGWNLVDGIVLARRF